MLGVRDYVMGLDPGNCHPDGRDVMRREGKLTFLKPGEEVSYQITITMIDDRAKWEEVTK